MTNRSNHEKILYTVKEVSELIHTNQAYVYTLIRAGLLPALKLGSYKVRKEALFTFLEANEGKNLNDPHNACVPFVYHKGKICYEYKKNIGSSKMDKWLCT